MTKNSVRFSSIILAGLVAGIILGIWLGFNPSEYSYTTYVEQQQGMIRSLNTLMPLLGLLAILVTLVSAYQQKNSRVIFVTLIIAAVLMIVSGIVTRFGNQPINAIVMSWDSANAPADWTSLRDRWWSFHQLRCVTAVAGFLLIAWVNSRKD